jgi:pilus assembly protein CpaB
MNPGRANRRFMMLAIVLGLIGAILVYVTFARESSSGGGGGGGVANTAVVVAKENIPARTKITPAMLDVKLVAADTRSPLSFEDPALVAGQVTRFPIAVNEQVLSSKIVPLNTTTAANQSLSFVVPQGKRGMAVTVSEVVNAGGLVLPGDYVDILVIYDIEFQTKPGDPASKEKVDSYYVQTLMQNIEVLAVSQGIVDIVPEATPAAGGQRVRNSEGKPAPEAATVTLALTPEQAQILYLAESNGRIRLSVRPYGEGNERPIEGVVEIDLFPRNLPNPFLR